MISFLEKTGIMPDVPAHESRIRNDTMPNDSAFEIARKQIEFARTYSLSLLDDIDDDQWFLQPNECVSHIAWQVGHLAMSEYMLIMFRLRGKQPDDESLISKQFLRQFRKGSMPQPEPHRYPTPAEIRKVFTGVHARVLQELDKHQPNDIDATVIEPYAVYNTKLGSLFFCSAHEMLHAGQIGLIRRLLGKPTLR